MWMRVEKNRIKTRLQLVKTSYRSGYVITPYYALMWRLILYRFMSLQKNIIIALFLLLGVNVPDHTMTFRSLCNLLQESVTPFVVSLYAKECAGMFKTLYSNHIDIH